MKKLNTLLMGLAAAAMTFTACSDAEDIMPNNGNNGKGVTIIAENPDVTNDTRTLVGYEGKNIIPMWSQYDQMSMYGTGAIYDVTFDRAEAEPSNSKTAVFKEKYVGDFKSILETSDKVYAIYSQNNRNTVSGDIVTMGTNFSNNFIGYDEDITNNPRVLYNDILISEAMKPADVLANGEVKPHFKRFTAVVRVNIKDETKDKVVGGADYSYFEINNEKDYFYTDVKFNMQTGEVSKDSEQWNAQKLLRASGKNSIIENGKPFYLTSLPVSLQQGDKITFKVQTLNGYKFQKIVTLDAKGLNIESGKITTLNINLKDADITVAPIVDPTPDPSIDPTYTAASGVITMKDGHYGRLTAKMLLEAITTDAKIKVVGNINAFDLNSILKLVRDTKLTTLDNFVIDLSDARIIGGDGSKCSGYNDDQYEISESDVLPLGILYNDNKTTKRLILPNSLKKIQYSAIYLYNTEEIVIGTGTETIEQEALYMSNNQAKIFILAGPETATGIADGFTYSGNNELYLNKSWMGNAAGPQAGSNVWKGITWGSIDYCDVNGNPLPKTEGGADLPDVSDNGNVL